MKKEVSEPISEIGYYISRLRKAFTNNVHRNFANEGIEIRFDAWLILLKLMRSEKPLNQADIADLIHRDKATITRSIKRLEQLDLITVLLNEQDKRQKIISLTKKGEALYLKGKEQVNEVIEVSKKDVEPSEYEICKQVLDKMYFNINSK